MQVQFSAELEDVKARKDRTLSIKISTQELSADETALIFNMFMQPIYVALAETDIKRLEVPEDLPDFKEDKTPSKRLRSRLFVFWKDKINKGDFEGWYRTVLDEIGQQYLEKLK